MAETEWIRCPICGNKTRDKIRDDTVLKNYPLYCPKCKQECLIEAKDLQITVIKGPPHRRRADELVSNHIVHRLFCFHRTLPHDGRKKKTVVRQGYCRSLNPYHDGLRRPPWYIYYGRLNGQKNLLHHSGVL